MNKCTCKRNLKLKKGWLYIDKEYTYEIIKTFVRVYVTDNKNGYGKNGYTNYYKPKYFNFSKKDFKEYFTSVNMQRKEKLKNISFLYEEKN